MEGTSTFINQSRQEPVKQPMGLPATYTTSPQSPRVMPSFADRLLGRGSYMKAFRKRRTEIVKQYRQDKQRLLKTQRQQERDLKKDLQRDQEKIRRYYGLGRYGLNEVPAGMERQAHKADRKYTLAERKTQRKFARQQRAAVRDLQRARDKQIQMMRKQLREETLAV